MKIFLSLITIMGIVTTSHAVDYRTSLYPDSNEVKVITSNNLDTVFITITNLSQEQVTDFHLTGYATDSLVIAELTVDGVQISDFVQEFSFGTIYSNHFDCRVIVSNFSQSLSVKFISQSPDVMHFSFVGNQPFGFFGIVEQILTNCCVGIRGNVNNDLSDGIDISDLIFLVSYMFKQGQNPVCWDEANVNGDVGNEIDISDLVMLVNYMFKPETQTIIPNCP